MKPTITPLVLSSATFGLMLGIAQNAQAALIPAISVTTSLGVDPSIPWNINNTVNGQGLPSNTPSLTGNHLASNFTGTAWRSANLTVPSGSTISGDITFTLGGTYSVSGFTFWNFGGSSFNLASQGIRDVTVEFRNGSGAWLPVPGAPTTFAFGQFDPSGVGTTLPDQLPQAFTFAPVTATQIRFVSLSTFTNAALVGSNNQLGFNEVQFDGTPQVPEPSSLLALLAVGLGGVSLRKRI